MPRISIHHTRPRLRHRRSSRRLRRFATIGLAACFAVLAIAIATVTHRSTPAPLATAADDDLTPEGVAEETFQNTETTDRADYLYSVIPGGAFNEHELRRAITADPVVAAHYTQLDQSRIRAEIVTRDRFVHVSYRKGNQVFWTKKKLRLRRGETILTDGTTQIRARCGNCISEEPLGPTAQEEPDIIEFDRLTDAPPELRAGTVASGFALPAAPTPPTQLGISGVPPARTTPTGAVESRSPASGLGYTASSASFDTTFPSSHVAHPSRPPTVPGIDFVSLGDNSFPRSDGSSPPLDEIIRMSIEPDPFPADDPLELPYNGEPVNPVPVPEPGTLLMVAGGVTALVRKLRARAGTRNPAF